MNTSPAVFPGTFDPLTLGHLDIIRRAARVFGRVIVAVAASPAKHPLFTLEERVETARRSVQDLGCVEVKGFSGMLVDFLRQEGASVLVAHAVAPWYVLAAKLGLCQIAVGRDPEVRILPGAYARRVVHREKPDHRGVHGRGDVHAGAVGGEHER